jgi:GT2 family glycosyltransferase
MEKIDVCVVSRDGSLPKGLEHIPINNLIIETISPVGEARRRCISKVTTRLFAFIDDDIIIDEGWFDILYHYVMKDNVGAVWGTTIGEGYGWFSKYSYDRIPLKKLKYGERFNTSNCLIKTEIVKDWVPTYGLNCYEDLDLGNYIMSKGYGVLFVPSNAVHYKNWSKLRHSALWAGYWWVEAYRPNREQHIKEYVRRIVAPVYASVLKGVPYALYVLYRNLFFVIGMIQRDIHDFIFNIKS